MSIPEKHLPYWKAFTQATGEPDDSRFCEAFAFGDSPELASELADLVLRGIKHATATSLWTFEAQGTPLSQPGDLCIVTDWEGAPLCVIETQEVAVVPFSQVSPEFAAAEGEGDGSLAFWREGHTQYFNRECARLGTTFTESMPVVCERFRVLYTGGAASPANPASF